MIFSVFYILSKFILKYNKKIIVEAFHISGIFYILSKFN